MIEFERYIMSLVSVIEQGGNSDALKESDVWFSLLIMLEFVEKSCAVQMSGTISLS